MHRRLTLVSALTAAVVFVLAPAALATNASDASSRLVVPFTGYDSSLDTRLFVENHENFHILVHMRYEGEVTSSSPGHRTCHPVGGTAFLLPPTSVTAFDLRSICALNGPTDAGLVILTVKVNGSVARISARARVDVLNPRPGAPSVRSQTFFVDGIPIGNLETTETLHFASGLRESPLAGGITRRIDCFVGALFDGSGAGGMLVRVGLRDNLGATLGHDQLFAIHPLEFVKFADVFTLVGAPITAQDGVRVEFGFAGGGDGLAGFCWTDQMTTAGGGLRTLTLSAAQVVDPTEETRRRSFLAGSTPNVGGLGAGAPFHIDPTNTRVVHGIWVRHPDAVTCHVTAAADPLVLTAVSPDKSIQTASVAQTVSFGNVPHGTVNFGVNDLWGLEVSWDPAAAKAASVPYTIACESSNGTSLADELFRN
jgi:hypothetical protein